MENDTAGNAVSVKDEISYENESISNVKPRKRETASSQEGIGYEHHGPRYQRRISQPERKVSFQLDINNIPSHADLYDDTCPTRSPRVSFSGREGDGNHIPNERKAKESRSPQRSPKVSFSLGSGEGNPIPNSRTGKKTNDSKSPRVSFSLGPGEGNPIPNERTNKNSTKESKPSQRSPKANLTINTSLAPDEQNASSPSSSSSEETDRPRRPSRQRRSGVVNSPDIGRVSSAVFLDNLPSTQPKEQDDQSSSTISDSVNTDITSTTRANCEEDLGQVNCGYESDEILDNIALKVESIIQDAQTSEMKNGYYHGGVDSKDGGPEGDNYEDEDDEDDQGLTFDLPPKDTLENTKYETPVKKESKNIDFGTPLSIMKHKKSSFADSNYSDDSTSPGRSSLARHLRKDSIALTSEKMGQIRDLQRHYKMMKKNNMPSFWKRKTASLKKYQLHVAVATMFMFVVTIVAIGWHFHDQFHEIWNANQRVFFQPSSRVLTLRDPDDNKIMANLGVSIPIWLLPSHCANEKETGSFTCLKWKNNAVLRIRHFGSKNVNCYNITWEVLREDLFPEDCFVIGTNVWFGPSNTSNALWSLDKVNFTFTAAETDFYPAGTFSSAMERYWISSGGGSIYVHNEDPVSVKWNLKNDNKICLVGNNNGSFYGQKRTRGTDLNYTVCHGTNPVTTHKFVRKLLPKGPNNLPSWRSLKYPVWSTFGVAQSYDITDNDIYGLAKEINERNLNCSFIEIDGKWEQHFGDLDFDSKRFPNITAVVKYVKSLGYSLSVEVSPYFGYKSINFDEGIDDGNFILDAGRKVPAFLPMQNSIYAMLDITNPSAESWMKMKMIRLSSTYKITAFHIFYRNRSWMPFSPSFHAAEVTPSMIRNLFAELVTSFNEVDADIVEGTSGSQNQVSFINIPTKVSIQSEGECITGVIETALTLGIMGYPFVIVDGMFVQEPNAGLEEFDLPNRQLYIRWMQMASFFPAMKFAVPPWSFDDECVELARNASALHQEYTVKIINEIQKEIKNGDPIIRPIWWTAPSDEEAHRAKNEFMIGDSLLVAPVVCDHVTERHIYLPEGFWTDMLTGDFIYGERWLLNYEVKINQIPHFKRKTVIGH
ncbi:SITS-binding protein-like [Ylistrum balloti]|uniref:SITS-binding protein-like n=1 Tax=Ylistrum balloti TaxID=509963 RepID=UPI002905D20B|nr:SITS-binding protein-like [Ylistrum balloti]